MIWSKHVWELFLFAYCLGIFLGFGAALDVVEQTKETRFEYTTKWEIVKWMLDPRKKSIVTPEEEVPP